MASALAVSDCSRRVVSSVSKLSLAFYAFSWRQNSSFNFSVTAVTSLLRIPAASLYWSCSLFSIYWRFWNQRITISYGQHWPLLDLPLGFLSLRSSVAVVLLGVWFCLVRRSTAMVRVCTCLSRAVGRGSSPWMLLVVVAIERVRTMQLLVQEAFVMAYKSRAFPQTAPTDDAVNITNELHDLRTLVTIPAQKREKT